jgi:hypothetical protein
MRATVDFAVFVILCILLPAYAIWKMGKDYKKATKADIRKKLQTPLTVIEIALKGRKPPEELLRLAKEDLSWAKRLLNDL